MHNQKIVPALLILTINDIHPYLAKFIKEKQIATFIHAKNKISACKEYIIKEHINTQWGDISIIHATIALLRAAVRKKCNYFILVSGDTIPNNSLLKNIANYVDKSIFSRYTINAGFYKTSQWWCMNGVDANVILSTYKKYLHRFRHNLIRGIGAPDELFFLTILQEHTRGYSCHYIDSIQTRWISDIVKHPTTIGIMTKYDIDIYHKSLIGIRKCTQTCEPIIRILPDKVDIIIVGTKTDQQKIANSQSNNSIIILTPLETIDASLRDRAVSITFFYYGDMDNFIITYLTKMQKYLSQWSTITLIDEEGQEIKPVRTVYKK